MISHFLYIAEEQGFSEFSKFGITNQPFERLRKLQQGNPRKLRFVYLFCGSYMSILDVESSIKQRLRWLTSEWVEATPARLKEIVIDQYKKIKEDEKWNKHRFIEIREIVDSRIVPYASRTPLTCRLNKNRLTIDQLYETGNVIS